MSLIYRDTAHVPAAGVNRHIIDNGIALLKWKDLQPTRTEWVIPTLPRSVTGVRILGGASAPVWVMEELDSFGYHEPVSGAHTPVPLMWQNAERYTEMWHHLWLWANHEIKARFTFVTGGATLYGEPMIRGTASEINRDWYKAEGIDFEVDSALVWSLLDAQADAWDGDLYLSLNPWTIDRWNVDGVGRAVDFASEAYDEGLIQAAGHHNLREEPKAGHTAMWDAWQATGRPVYWQTANPKQIGDWSAALRTAAEDYRAPTHVELNRDWWEYNSTVLAQWQDVFSS